MNTSLMIYSQQVKHFIPTFLISVLIFIVFWIAAVIAKVIINRFAENKNPDYAMAVQLLAQTVKIAILVFGFITALGTLGVNVAGLVAGIGLTGFAIGFALKDSISNLLAGIMILIYRPYRSGDLIAVGGKATENCGKVTEINLRFTVLQDNDDKYFIPNSLILNSVVKVIKEKEKTTLDKK